jgi:hypothetical protein
MRVPRNVDAVWFDLPRLLAEDKVIWAQNPDAVPVLMEDDRLPAVPHTLICSRWSSGRPPYDAAATKTRAPKPDIVWTAISAPSCGTGHAIAPANQVTGRCDIRSTLQSILERPA